MNFEVFKIFQKILFFENSSYILENVQEIMNSKKFKKFQNFTRILFDFLPQGHETQTFSEKTTFFKDFKIGGVIWISE